MQINVKSLIESALEARDNSYSPYSHYKVGAAILCEDGSVVTGCNIENASYGLTICAERCAAFKAVSEGKVRFCAIAVCGGGDNETDHLSDYAYPCGACRQVLREFANPDSFYVYVAKSVDEYKKYTLSELLPDSFGPDNLNQKGDIDEYKII